MKIKLCGIYCIENTINNKKYIGQSVDMYKRLCQHKVMLRKNIHSNRHLNDSFNIYGEENFIFYVLDECEYCEINNLEKYYIKLYNTIDNNFGYNMLLGGEGGGKGRIISKEQRIKLSAAGKGRKFSKERNLRISLSKKGIPR